MDMWGSDFNEGYRKRRITDRDIREAITYDIFLRYRIADLMGVKFEKIDVLPDKAWKHTCVGVGIVEKAPIQVIVGEEVPVKYLFCNKCYKVIYFVEQVY